MASGCDTVTFLSGAFRVAQQETSDGGSAPFGCVFYPTTPYVGLDPPGGTTGNGLTLARPILVPAHAPRQPPQDMLVQTTSYRRTCVCACVRVVHVSARGCVCVCARVFSPCAFAVHLSTSVHGHRPRPPASVHACC